ncbi:hypothetical protein K1W69_10505 [Hoeflea sp. WL0058]|uniref:Uncharacterized protein n=1 Tax=Flavimaribacter sediminis TaxID=2865987 RepID=A0AAE2ZK11_9HYPH|nr:hypothetical protein [Flavimaribacter sediminis]MBW8637616.1 hypothetical protein [Flavimaribacter sediminis]
MTAPTVSELESRLNAQRKLVVHLVWHLARTAPNDDFLDHIVQDGDLLDQEEDPGADPTGAFAQQARMAAEVRAIVDQVRARLDAESADRQ